MGEEKKDTAEQNSLENDSLEAPSTEVKTADSESNSLEGTSTPEAPTEDTSKKKSKKSSGARGGVVGFITTHLNVYMLLFLLLLVVAGLAIFISYQSSKKEAAKTDIKVEKLSEKDLAAIQNSTTTVGDAKSVLNVESNAVFNGRVLIRDSLDVAGTIKVGGALALPGITVSGTSQFDEVKVNNMSISGNATVLGQLSVQKSLLVSGGATFGGPLAAPQLNIDNLQINKDLVLNRHIAAGGVTPGLVFGSALGAGGTASVNGSDTAGTLTVNTGGSPTAGCFATINFSQKFNSTPHIAVSPVGASAGSLNYYINRTSSSLSICTASAAPASSSFGFDYVAFD